MNKSELETMRNSFKVLDERRSEILNDPKIKKLQEKVKQIREESIENLEELVETAQKNFEENGIELFYAENSEIACDLIYDLIKNEKIVAKSKSNTVFEIALSDFLKEKNIGLVETDLGDRIVQLNTQ